MVPTSPDNRGSTVKIKILNNGGEFPSFKIYKFLGEDSPDLPTGWRLGRSLVRPPPQLKIRCAFPVVATGDGKKKPERLIRAIVVSTENNNKNKTAARKSL